MEAHSILDMAERALPTLPEIQFTQRYPQQSELKQVSSDQAMAVLAHSATNRLQAMELQEPKIMEMSITAALP